MNILYQKKNNAHDPVCGMYYDLKLACWKGYNYYVKRLWSLAMQQDTFIQSDCSSSLDIFEFF